jgi:hypothetical protein
MAMAMLRAASTAPLARARREESTMARWTLSAGALKKVYDTGDVSDNLTVQIWDVKPIGETTPPV